MDKTASNLLDFPCFFTHFTECIAKQDSDFVNNRPLALFLKENPELFLEYLLKILNNPASPYRKQAILLIKSFILQPERLLNLGSAFKIQYFKGLFVCLTEIAGTYLPAFALFENIIDLFAEIYSKHPENKEFLPAELTANLANYKEIEDLKLKNVVLCLISKLLFANNDNTYAELINVHDFLEISIEKSQDIWFLSAEVNICIKLIGKEEFQAHHSALIDTLLKCYEYFINCSQWRDELALCEEFFGYLMNFMADDKESEFLSEHSLVSKVLDLHQCAPMEIKRVFTIFLANCTKYSIDDQKLTAIFEAILSTFAESIQEPDEAWLTNISFDKMSSEQNIICDYQSLAHYHFVCMILYSNLSDEQAFVYLKKFSKEKDWRLICALLTALATLVSFTDLQGFEAVFPYIFSSLNHENPKIRLALLKLIDEMAIEYGQELYKRTNKLYESKIIARLDDPVPRIKIMASCMLVSYYNEIPKKIALKKIQWIIPILKNAIANKEFAVIPELLSLTSEFVHQLEEEIKDFTAELIPLVISLKPEGVPASEESNFYGKIMEFLSIFIQALDQKLLVDPYKEQIINILLFHQGKIKNEITLKDIYLLDAWQRVAIIYRKEVQGYLGVVIGKMIPLGIKYMKDKEDLKEINETFRGDYPRIFHTEVNRDKEIIKNLGEILKIYLENGENEGIKNADALIVFLLTAYKEITETFRIEKKKIDENKDLNSKDEENIFYQDFHYFYKDLISCGFLFLQRYSANPDKKAFLSTFKRLTNSFWTMAEESPLNEKSLIKLQYNIYESLRFSVNELPTEAFSNEEVNVFIDRIQAAWKKILEIDFDSYENDIENEGDEEETFIDFRLDLYFVVHEVISNMIKRLSPHQKTSCITILFPNLYEQYLNEYYDKEILSDIEEDILSSILFSLVEVLQEISIETLHGLPWEKILESLIKYTIYDETLIRHNAAYALGLFHEKIEAAHDLFPSIFDFVERSLENLEKATLISAGEEDEESQNDFIECLDNVFSAIGRMVKVYFGNNEFIKPELLLKYFQYLPIKHDVQEGKDQHEILLEVLLKFWGEFIEKKPEIYLEIIRIISELCLGKDDELISLKGKKKIKKLLKIIKENDPQKFQNHVNELNEDAKNAIISCLNDKDLDED